MGNQHDDFCLKPNEILKEYSLINHDKQQELGWDNLPSPFNNGPFPWENWNQGWSQWNNFSGSKK